MQNEILELVQRYTLPEWSQIIRDIVLSVIGVCGLVSLICYRKWFVKWSQETKLEELLTESKTALANGNEIARISAVQSAIQVARESKSLSKEKGLRIRNRVMEDICSHVRRTTGDKEYQSKHKEEPSHEIQTILTHTFVKNGDVFEGCTINLEESYLKGADLERARLEYANLSLARIQSTKLHFAKLQCADLTMANLQGAYLYRAWLQGAILTGAWMQGSGLMNANLHGTALDQANLQGAELENTKLQGALLCKADLRGGRRSNFHVPVDEQIVCSLYPPSAHFESRIRNLVDKNSILTGTIFSGGLQKKGLDILCKGLSADHAKALRAELTPHVGKPISNKLPEDSWAITGSYTEDEAEQWIKEYREATISYLPV